MLSEERQLRILALVRERGFVTVVDLCDTFDVSEATIRRDLDTLAQQGQVRRLRGGAGDMRGTVRPEPDLRSFAEVAADPSSAPKRAIAKAAARLVEDGDVIVLDSGTTVAAMCPFLAAKSLTVVTASLPVIESLQAAPTIDLIVIGGILRTSYRSMVGHMAESMLRQMRFDKAFLGTAGVTNEGFVMDTTPSEVPVKRQILASSRESFLLADAEKFPGEGFLRVSELADFRALITDRAPKNLTLPDGVEVEVLVA
jgi:DeoR family transcriptional regulator, fructose operon transcriptional repressor